MNPIPHNPVEAQLASVDAGTPDPETFELRLPDQQLSIPARDEKNAIQGVQRSVQARSLIIEDGDGERVLRRMGGGVPISLNPGRDAGMDVDAAMTAQRVTQHPLGHSA